MWPPTRYAVYAHAISTKPQTDQGDTLCKNTIIFSALDRSASEDGLARYEQNPAFYQVAMSRKGIILAGGSSPLR